METLDLVEIEVEVRTRRTPGGAVFARLFSNTLGRMEERMLALGAAGDDLAAAQRLLRDPTVTYQAPTFTIAWGRRRD